MPNDSAGIAAECALAVRLGMTESMVSRLEGGSHVPSLRTLCRIADVFGRRIEIVFHDHEHAHDDGTQHSHIHSSGDPEHDHLHGEAESG
ncbi:MAG: cro/C1-type protein [Dehalococcoidia bacterium]|nr:cro/C1-type protein [Dehalococcoidia bacterium]